MTSHQTSVPTLVKAMVAATFCVAVSCQAGHPVAAQVDVVTKLYKDFAFESVIEEPEAGAGVLSSNPAVQAKYFTPRLSALIREDANCTVKTHEICKLDWLPIWDSQDPIGATVKVLATSKTNKVNVEVRYQQEVKTLTYTLQRIGQGWRIDDISYGTDRLTLRETLDPRK